MPEIADAMKRQKPLKVLFLLHDSRRSGVPAVMSNVVRLLDKTDIKPAVCFAYDGIYAQELRAAGIEVDTLGQRTPVIWRIKRFLLNLLLARRAGRFDIIHVCSIKLALSVVIAHFCGAKVVFHLHELPRRIGWLLRTAMAQADAVLFCSETCAEHFSAVPARMKRTIVNAMLFPELRPVAHRNGKLRIVMAASINRDKGQDLLLKAFALLRNRDAELWLYGTIGLSAHKYVCDLKRFVAEHGLTGRVFFPGPTSDVFSVFSEAAVVVHTSWTESFGMALVEAQSCGVPVIAHDLEGMREVVADGITGYLIPPGDTGILAERLDELLSDHELRNRLGNAGYAMMREKFDMDLRSNDYLTLYRDICTL